MKIKNVNLEWYVLLYDFNSNEVKPYNILGKSLLEDIHKRILKKKINNFDELKEFLKKEFMYHYWSKSEYEMLVR